MRRCGARRSASCRTRSAGAGARRSLASEAALTVTVFDTALPVPKAFLALTWQSRSDSASSSVVT